MQTSLTNANKCAEKFSERLWSLMIKHKITSPNELGKRLKYERTEKIMRLFRPTKEGDKNMPSYEVLIDIANFFADEDMRWLLTGKVHKGHSTVIVAPESEVLADRVEELSKDIEELKAQIFKKKKAG